MLSYCWHLTRFLGLLEKFYVALKVYLNTETIKLKLVTFLLPEACLEGLDQLMEAGLYPSRSAAIRFAVHDLLRREFWQPKKMNIKEDVTTKRKGRMRRPPTIITLI